MLLSHSLVSVTAALRPRRKYQRSTSVSATSGSKAASCINVGHVKSPPSALFVYVTTGLLSRFKSAAARNKRPWIRPNVDSPNTCVATQSISADCLLPVCGSGALSFDGVSSSSRPNGTTPIQYTRQYTWYESSGKTTHLCVEGGDHGEDEGAGVALGYRNDRDLGRFWTVIWDTAAMGAFLCDYSSIGERNTP
jgi:hypothetical protein